MRYRYELLDVFTERPGGGNPLAVFLDAMGLDAAAMQQAARELNLSESVFLTPAAMCGEWHARIFTPAIELPFAGHPTIGAAIALARSGRSPGAACLTLHEAVGRIRVELADGGHRASFAVPAEPEVGEALPSTLLARILGLADEDILGGAWRPRRTSCGVPFHIVALRSLAALSRVRLQPALWRNSLAADRAPHLYAVAADTGGEADFRARMFAPAMGIAEDPATGGAAAALAGFLAAAMPHRQGLNLWRIDQGIEMGRPSRIELSAELSAGTARGTRVGGAAVMVGSGHLDLPERNTVLRSAPAVSQAIAAHISALEPL